MRFLSRLEKTYEFWFLLGLSVVFFLLRLPSLTEPYWYGDEGIYHAIGMGLRDGRLLYTEIWDNKPPVLYLIYTLLSEQFYVRFLSLSFGVASVWAFFYLARELLKNHKAITISTSIFALLFGLPILEGNVANAENFMVLPVILACYFFYKTVAKTEHAGNDARLPFIAGILLGFAFLTKIVAIFDLFALLTFYFLYTFKQEKLHFRSALGHLTSLLQKSPRYLLFGFFLPYALSLVYFLIQGNIGDYIRAMFLQNVGYVGKENVFFIAQGLLILKCLLLAIVLLLIFRYKRFFTPSTLFVLVWFAFSLFNASFSGRPYTHYLLVLLPSFCLLVGLVFKARTHRAPLFLALLAIIVVLVMNFDFYMVNRTFRYYPNFVKFIFNKISIVEYYASFDRRTIRDYGLAIYLKTTMQPGEKVFLWGDSAQVYKLADKIPPGRYTVAYHVVTEKAIEETEQMITKEKPDIIVGFRDVEDMPFPISDYRYKGSIQNTDIYERIN